MIDQAAPDDVEQLGLLLWKDTCQEEPEHGCVDAFVVELARWWGNHRESHSAFVARSDGSVIVGMAWVALIPRIPRPGAMMRVSADIQTVFVMSEHRGRGIGSALINAATKYALHRGASYVTVHSGRRAVPVYERLGFASSRHFLQRYSK